MKVHNKVLILSPLERSFMRRIALKRRKNVMYFRRDDEPWKRRRICFICNKIIVSLLKRFYRSFGSIQLHMQDGLNEMHKVFQIDRVDVDTIWRPWCFCDIWQTCCFLYSNNLCWITIASYKSEQHVHMMKLYYENERCLEQTSSALRPWVMVIPYTQNCRKPIWGSPGGNAPTKSYCLV